MLLQSQSKGNVQFYSNSAIKQASNLNYSNDSQVSSTKRTKTQYHNKIRIRQLQQIKAQKRKLLQINQVIEQVLTSDFPRESQDARNWAYNLAELYKTSKHYETDPFKLRQIFTLAQKFPNLGTLTLFYLSILNTNSKNVRTLFDLDVWRFLHNILQFPGVKEGASHMSSKSEVKPYSPPSKNLNTNFVQTKLIKVAIQTFISLYGKDVSFRDYSIGKHQTFSNYLKPTYKKYRESIKTEMVLFLHAVFICEPKQYSKQYMNLIKFTNDLLIQYKVKFYSFLTCRKWGQLQMRQSIQEAVKRASYLVGVMTKIMEFSQIKWLSDFVSGLMLRNQFGYLVIVDDFLTFGERIINQLYKNEELNNENNQILSSAIQLMHNTFLFYQAFIQNTLLDGMQNPELIHKITQRVAVMLHFLKKCQQKKLFINGERCLLLDVQKTKQVCLFILDESINSQFDKYQNFSRHFIFLKGEDGNQINLLETINYFLRTQHYQRVLSELIGIIFSMLKIQVPSEQVHKFVLLLQIIQKLCDMLIDNLISEDLKVNICIQFLTLFSQYAGKLGQNLKIIEIFLNNCNKIQAFMYSQGCTKQLFRKLQQLYKWIKNNQYNQNQIRGQFQFEI